jgi:hypothetical protein
MKINKAVQILPTCLVAGALMAVCSAKTALAAPPALQGQIALRPLTPSEIKDYALTGAQGASGLSTVGVGQPVYLEALVNNAVPDSGITNVTWVLTARPPGSAAALTASPLGANVPTFKVADRINQAGAAVFKVAGADGRTMLRPDVTGQYTVTATIRTASSGTTNLTQTITAGTYMGINTCALCHSGGVQAPDKYSLWSLTDHATIFTRSIDGLETDYHSKSSILRHTLGYDTNFLAVNGGFDDVATQVGWTFPATLTDGNWAALTNKLKDLANVQCENCHGPGSQHVFGEVSDPHSPGAKAAIAVSFIAGNCAQCHDNMPQGTAAEIKYAEWSNSLHSHSTRSPSGPGREQCVRCHTAPGFRNFIENAGTTNSYVTNTVYEAITCAACHDPHDASNPHQLRAANSYTLPEGTTVTNVGLGALCMECHHSRNGEANQNIANYKLGLPTWAGGSSFGPHDSTAGDMVEGVNAITYGKVIPSGSHSSVIPNVCVGCHMQPVATTDPAFGQAGGHTYSMTYKVVNGGITNTVAKVDVCIKCHGPITEFDFARKDYDGDGVIEGVQTEVQHLLDNLSRLLPNSTYRADGNYVADGLVKTIDPRTTVKTNWPTKFLQAAWNYAFVSVEGSHGVHNAPYAVGILKASIADLTGDANNDSLPDSWQIQYFGSATAPNAAPNAAPAGDGVPNWLKYALGLNPMVPGIAVPDGVVWANASAIGGGTNTIHIYTAAEIVFDTEAGKSYQIQSVSSLSAGWQNVGAPIAGTGQAISYVTPTRSNAQQFYRVFHTP